jgi:hypothetical protein
MTIDAVRRDLCKNFDLSAAAADNKQFFSLVFNEDITVNFELVPGTNVLCMFAYICPTYTGEKNRCICKKIMSKNTYGECFGNLIVSLSEKENMFIISRKFDLSKYEKDDLLAELQTMLSAIRDIKKLCQECLENPEDISSKPSQEGIVGGSFLKI